MSCSYYENKSSGWFSSNAYYCHKKGDYVNEDAWDRYCKGYSYSDCPIYKGSSSGGCYLTSACVYAMGLADDCDELQTLRHYRDTWMKLTKEGRELIKQYYEIAPRVVSVINERQDKKSVYQKIYEEMVLPCVKLIKQEKYDETLELYKSYTLKLSQIYL